MARFGKGDALTGTRQSDGSYIPAMQLVDGNGNATSNQTYTLASNATITATTGTTPVTGVQGGSYIWDVQFTGTSVTLQALGSDGVTWRDVATRTSSGTTGVVIGQGASVRLYNPNNAALTGVYSNLS
ncbi:hypothetical protein AV944_11085 [Sphingomonas sp. LK11]|nr:hypothetical protein [Sphingomonas sp. LK11]APX66283.1 hypothetical protein AV944_11085 [Sphingomonas sp. LK11]